MDNSRWGKSVAINISGCQHSSLVSVASIQTYIRKVIELISMKAHGECIIERFGEGSLEGISAMQFIETSSITVHCDEVGDRVFIDIFSCKDFDSALAVRFSKKYFGGTKVTSRTLLR